MSASDHRPSAPPTSPHGVWWCASGCDVGGMDTACPECGGPMVPSHPGSVGLVTDGGLHVSR